MEQKRSSEIVEFLTHLRAQAGNPSLREIARLSGLSHTTVRKALDPEAASSVSFNSKFRVAHALGASANDLRRFSSLAETDEKISDYHAIRRAKGVEDVSPLGALVVISAAMVTYLGAQFAVGIAPWRRDVSQTVSDSILLGVIALSVIACSLAARRGAREWKWAAAAIALWGCAEAAWCIARDLSADQFPTLLAVPALRIAAAALLVTFTLVRVWPDASCVPGARTRLTGLGFASAAAAAAAVFAVLSMTAGSGGAGHIHGAPLAVRGLTTVVLWSAAAFAVAPYFAGRGSLQSAFLFNVLFALGCVNLVRTTILANDSSPFLPLGLNPAASSVFIGFTIVCAIPRPTMYDSAPTPRLPEHSYAMGAVAVGLASLVCVAVVGLTRGRALTEFRAESLVLGAAAVLCAGTAIVVEAPAFIRAVRAALRRAADPR